MSVNRLRVMFCISSFPLGGAAKNVERFVSHLSPSLFDVSVVGWESGGYHAEQLRARGVPVDVLRRDPAALSALIQQRRIQVFHVHRAGWSEPGPIGIAKAAGAPCILETNIFGAKDHSPEDRMIDLTLFKSKTSWLKYVLQNNVDRHRWAERWNYLYNPVELREIESLRLSRDQRRDLRQEMGFEESDEILGRIGRDDEGKFADILVDMIPYLMRRRPQAKILMVGAPDFYRRLIERFGFGSRCVFRPVISNAADVYRLNYCLDVLIHAAPHGESCGNVISEAMACARPVVSESTPFSRPWIDNAQIEQVDHGETGLIANYPSAFAGAVATLLKDQALRERMGERGCVKIKRDFNMDVIMKRLERIYAFLAAKKGQVLAPELKKLAEEGQSELAAVDMSSYEEEYRRRLKNTYQTNALFETMYRLKGKVVWHWRHR